jgi:hypothetical protein
MKTSFEKPLFHHSTIPLLLPRETLFYFTGAMAAAKTQASNNIL